MPRLLSLLLSGVLLSACHKSEEPAPNLEGPWQVQRQTHYNYNTNGSLAQKTGPVSLAGLYRVDITPDTLFIMSAGSPLLSRWDISYPCIRQGNLLMVPPVHAAQNIEPKDLTAYFLTLVFHEYPSVVGTSANEMELTR